MRETRRKAVVRVLTGLVPAVLLLLGPGGGPCYAQSLLSSVYSAIPVDSIEKYIGPILPREGIGSTFRSEVSTGVAASSLRGAKLIGSTIGQVDLRPVMTLDGGPNRYMMNSNIRIWRFGLRCSYQFFENRSRAGNQAKFDFSGFSFGGDVDLIQHKNIMLGVGADYYAIEPQLQGRFQVIVPGLPTDFELGLKGHKPSTAGPYVRIVPPAIIGYPLHIEAFYKFPINGSSLTSYGMAFAFRPQIYRFDLAIKIGLERAHLKFQTDPDYQSVDATSSTQNWEIDMEWEMLSLVGVVYF